MNKHNPATQMLVELNSGGITQEALSQLLEAKGVVCPQSQVSRICNGQQPFPALYDAVKLVYAENRSQEEEDSDTNE